MKRGYLIIQALVFGTIGIIIIGGLVGFAQINIKSARLFVLKERAFQIAEAGLEYYRWHLAHAPQDFQDGQGVAGPYVHQYKDKDSQVVGTFTLTITPPIIGSTVVTIVSEGKMVEDASLSRKLEVKLAIPSLAKYAFVANSAMRFGIGTEVFGPIHSNGGIRFDGLAHNIVSSAVANYDDPDHSGGNEFGVHTHITPTDPLPPAVVPSRTDIFLTGRQFPLPAVDFTGLTPDLATIKTNAQAGGRYFAGSGVLGYNLVLKIDDTFDLYTVNSLIAAPSGCTNYLSQSGWGTWSVNNQTLLGNYAFPANGLIFLEDNVWVEGQIQTARLTIAAGRFPENPSTNASIAVNKDIRYTTYDGQDIIALIAQNNFNVGMVSNSTLTIDAALLAKNGRVGRYYYRVRRLVYLE